ncbi:MAG: ATP-binding protein [Deltaproteobacteria bacterium]|nr:ATP-binding protein [Deltaproteobacteria bacterium]
MVDNYKRLLQLPNGGEETFFLWGPRQTGKSTLLRQTYPHAIWVDLLKPEEFRRYISHPEHLREELQADSKNRFVVIDEVQKVPGILDEVQYLHELYGIQFALCGSSARKLKHGNANMLGGRAIRYELNGFSLAELPKDYVLNDFLNRGYLPRFAMSNAATRLQHSYVANYLKEEIASEGLVRNLPSFSEFLNIAALSDTETVNYTNIARDVGLSADTVKNYFEILTDTMLGRFVQSYRRRPKRRISVAPKFYFSDVGVVNVLTRRGHIATGTSDFGKAFENWVFHELNSYNLYRERFADIHYWRLSTGVEVDFIINHIDVAIEVKSSDRIHSGHLKGLIQLLEDHPETKRRVVVCSEPKYRQTSEGIDIMPFRYFLEALWNGDLF